MSATAKQRDGALPPLGIFLPLSPLHLLQETFYKWLYSDPQLLWKQTLLPHITSAPVGGLTQVTAHHVSVGYSSMGFTFRGHTSKD
jgi:hypothetical protein